MSNGDPSGETPAPKKLDAALAIFQWRGHVILIGCLLLGLGPVGFLLVRVASALQFYTAIDRGIDDKDS